MYMPMYIYREVVPTIVGGTQYIFKLIPVYSQTEEHETREFLRESALVFTDGHFKVSQSS